MDQQAQEAVLEAAVVRALVHGLLDPVVRLSGHRRRLLRTRSRLEYAEHPFYRAQTSPHRAPRPCVLSNRVQSQKQRTCVRDRQIACMDSEPA